MPGARRSRAPAITSTPASPVRDSPAPRALTLTATRADRLLGLAPQRMGASVRETVSRPPWGQSRPPPFSTGSGPLPWEPRHCQMLLPPSLFRAFVRMHPTCAARLCVSGAQSLEKAGVPAGPSFRDLGLQGNWPQHTIGVGGRSVMRKGRRAGRYRHAPSAPVLSGGGAPEPDERYCGTKGLGRGCCPVLHLGPLILAREHHWACLLSL